MKKHIHLRIKSFKYALEGLKQVYKSEINIWMHTLALFFVISGGIMYKISLLEWISIVIVSAFVFVAEIMNTCIERICDMFTKLPNHEVKIIKDMAAAFVLIASISSVLIGCIIFLPKIFI